MKYLLILVVLFSASTASAQLFPSRSFIPSTSFRDSADSSRDTRYLTQQGMWGNLSHGFHSTGERYAWDISFGGFFELVQWKQSGIALVGDFEILSDIYNNINFNPRAIFWTEGLLYSMEFDNPRNDSKLDFSVGYIHRCKHDIDNLDSNVIGTGEERTLIYGSAVVRLLLKNVPPIIGIRNDFALQFDQYLVRLDEKKPRIPSSQLRSVVPSMSTINSSFTEQIRFDLFKATSVTCYLREWLTIGAFESYSLFTVNLRGEIGLQFEGQDLLMNIFAGGESLADDLNSLRPTRSRSVFVGFRFIGKNVGF